MRTDKRLIGYWTRAILGKCSQNVSDQYQFDIKSTFFLQVLVGIRTFSTRHCQFFRIDSIQINYTEGESLFLYPILIYFKELFILTHKIIRSPGFWWRPLRRQQWRRQGAAGKQYRLWIVTCPALGQRQPGLGGQGLGQWQLDLWILISG